MLLFPRGLQGEQEDSFFNSFIHNSVPLENLQLVFYTPGRMPAKHLVVFGKSCLVSVSTRAVWLISLGEMQILLIYSRIENRAVVDCVFLMFSSSLFIR